MIINRLPALASLLIALSVTIGTAAEVRFDGDHLYLSADRESLIQVLKKFERVGVDVYVEPGIDALVTGQIEGEDIDQAMDRLLESFNYVLFWDVLKGPVGPLPRLDEIHVFRPGKRRLVKPLGPTPANYDAMRHPLLVDQPFVRDELLVGLRPGVSADEFRALLKRLDATVVSSLAQIGVYKLRLPEGTDVLSAMKQLQAQDTVANVEPNYIYKVPDPSPIASGRQPGLPDPDDPFPNPNDPLARTSPGGFVAADPQNPSLAIFDSGLLSSVALDGSVLGRFDAVNPARSLSDPIGHGTQMAMVASGTVTPGGVSPRESQQRVPILAVRAFDDNGQATSLGLMRAIEYAIDSGAKVINMSWGTNADSEFLSNAIDLARQNGIVVVASVGNEPTQRPVYPAAFNNVIGVSAMNADGSLWEKSNYGSFVSAAAPGTGQFSVGHQGPPGSYAGTSIASAYVARAFALYFQDNPGTSAADAEKAFYAALTDSGPGGTDARYGRGALDAGAMQKFLGTGN